MIHKKTEQTYSVDKLMIKISSTLVRDFQTNLNDFRFCSNYLSELATGNIPKIRDSVPALSDQMDVATYKSTYQIISLFKRHRFRNDTYSDDELILKAINSFRDTQNRLAAIEVGPIDVETQWVLDYASRYIAKVLGVYDDEEHRHLCRFGKKASVGIPARAATLAARWEIPISGSPGQISWFDSEMSHIACIQDYWNKQLERDPKGSIYQETSSLTLTLVPKTFKSLRAIMPNTTIGSYMSFGLGEMIRKRLKRNGYDISTLQERHKYLARLASSTSLYTTADLSSASDSISVALVEKLFPADWVKILTQSRIGIVSLPDGTRADSHTFCTMGIGYTFPLQTLVFLALLKAIEARFWARTDRRTISVYGDDMIYATRMHEHVVRIFSRVGFVINLDKTYHEGYFRESCGGDYYHGVDVRPFQPQNGQVDVNRKVYEAVLYKCINGLLMRWTEYEVEGTLSMLVAECLKVTRALKRVPLDFPADAGVKCSGVTSHEFMRGCSVTPRHVGHGLFRFSYLRLVPDLREELRHEPYLWETLRQSKTAAEYHPASRSQLEGPRDDFWTSCINEVTGVTASKVSLLLIKELRPTKSARSKISGRRFRRTSTFVTISHTGRYMRQSGHSCFEDRR